MSAPAPLDLRLLPAGFVACGAAVVVVVLPVPLATSVGAAAAVGAVLVAVTGRAEPEPAAAAAVPRSWFRAGAHGARGQLVLVLLTAAAVLLAGAAQLAAREAGHLTDLAADRAVVRLAGTVVGDPARARSSWPGSPPQYRVLLAVHVVGGRGATSRAAAPVVVVGDDRWAAIAYGSAVVVGGRLAPARTGAREVARLDASTPPVVTAAAPAVLHGAGSVRTALAGVAATIPGDAGALLPGVAVGDTARVPDDLAAAMRTAGLTHLTAVSGAHFALVGAAVLALVGAMRIHRSVRAAVVVVVLAGFVALVHPGPSVLRAAAMGTLGLAGLVLGRPARTLSALAAGVVLLLVADPWLVREVGFVLSVVATAGLVTLAPPLAARAAGRLGAPAAFALAVPVAAQSACAPVILLLNPVVATYAVPANVLADPAVAPATVLGLLAALVAPWCPAVAGVLADVAGAACWWIAHVARTAAGLPGAQLGWPPGPRGALLLACGTAAALGLLLHARPRAGARRRHRFVAGWARATRDEITEPLEQREHIDRAHVG